MRAAYFKSGLRCTMALMGFGLAGCSPLLTPVDHYLPAPPINIPPPPKTNGTIFQPGYESRLYTDQVAYRIGDVLTVRLEESTKGEYSALTRTEKKASVDYPIPTVFGHKVIGLENKADSKQNFDGRGNSDQSNKLTGTITVSVVNVLSNHHLLIQGESWVTINQGQEYIQVTGIVRPEDISTNNTVSSQRIANAKISYGGKGQAGYASSGGLITRLFNRFALY